MLDIGGDEGVDADWWLRIAFFTTGRGGIGKVSCFVEGRFVCMPSPWSSTEPLSAWMRPPETWNSGFLRGLLSGRYG